MDLWVGIAAIATFLAATGAQILYVGSEFGKFKALVAGMQSDIKRIEEQRASKEAVDHLRRDLDDLKRNAETWESSFSAHKAAVEVRLNKKHEAIDSLKTSQQGVAERVAAGFAEMGARIAGLTEAVASLTRDREMRMLSPHSAPAVSGTDAKLLEALRQVFVAPAK